MEFVSGGELFDYIVSRGRLAPDEARHFFHQVCYFACWLVFMGCIYIFVKNVPKLTSLFMSYSRLMPVLNRCVDNIRH